MIPLSELHWNFLEIFYLIIIFIVVFLTTYFILPFIIEFMKKKKYVGYDIHKNAHPEIAESGGLSMVIGFTIASILLMVFFPDFFKETIIFLLTVLLAGAIGFIDDRIKFKSGYKIILSIFSGSAIFLANYFKYININSPSIPFLDKTRLTIIYPLVLPIIIAIFANTVNMLEGYNGEGSGTCLIAVTFLLICGVLWNSAEAIIFTIPIIAVIMPFFIYNKFPSKVFPGDIGTLSMGAMVAGIALFGSLEVAAFCALLIHIFNSFYVIYSVRGFLESSDIREKKEDIILLEDDRIKASDQKDAALTLPRLILAKGPLTEPELVRNFYAISIICGLFSIVSVQFLQFTSENINIFFIALTILILAIPTSFLLYKFPRIRGIILLMIILLVSGIMFLMIVEFVILQLPFATINLGEIEIPINLLFIFLLFIIGFIAWYYITIRYFWNQINKMKRLEIKE